VGGFEEGEGGREGGNEGGREGGGDEFLFSGEVLSEVVAVAVCGGEI